MNSQELIIKFRYQTDSKYFGKNNIDMCIDAEIQYHAANTDNINIHS